MATVLLLDVDGVLRFPRPDRVGRRKPNADYFEHLLQTIGRRPNECLFIDDAESCVTAATTVGIPSVRFLDNDRLISELTARGLLNP